MTTFHMSQQEMLDIRAPARAEAIAGLRHQIAAYAQQAGAGEELADSIRLAVSEALSNVVVHAYVDRDGGDMMLEAWRDEDAHLVIVVRDEGAGLVPRRAKTPGMGLGLVLMAQMADGFTLCNREGIPGTAVELRFALARGAVPNPATD
jgi:serine/threonine-protein kinase RsbW